MKPIKKNQEMIKVFSLKQDIYNLQGAWCFFYIEPVMPEDFLDFTEVRMTGRFYDYHENISDSNRAIDEILFSKDGETDWVNDDAAGRVISDPIEYEPGDEYYDEEDEEYKNHPGTVPFSLDLTRFFRRSNEPAIVIEHRDVGDVVPHGEMSARLYVKFDIKYTSKVIVG